MKKIEFETGDKEWLRKFENRLLFALYVAYLEARKGGKRSTRDEHQFELNADENLIKLRDDFPLIKLTSFSNISLKSCSIINNSKQLPK